MPTAKQAPAKGAPAKTAPPPTPAFRVGVYAQEDNDYDNTITMSASSLVNFPIYNPSPNDWLRGLWFLFECTTSGNSAATAFTADGPFSAIDHVTFRDIGQREVFGPITGYDWLTIMKFGGYHEIGDPRSDITYSVTTGTAATGGSFSMIMYLPLEVVKREALGELENKSGDSKYKVEVALAASAQVYSTAPTTLGTVRLRIIEDGYTEPMDADAHGRPFARYPKAKGTMQYWATEDDTINAGNGNYTLQNGLGYPIRNIIYKLVDSTGSRAQGDADWPDPVTLTFGKVQLFQRYKKLWLSRMGKAYGLTSTSVDVSLGRENGIFPVWFTDDFGFKPGLELRNAYLVTKAGNVLKWSGTIGGSGTHTMYATVNYIVPPADDVAALRSR
jgi:hypothetical protein